MFSFPNLKETRTYYNKFISAPKRSTTNLKLQLLDNNLIQTIMVDDIALRAIVSGTSDDFEPVILSFNDWYKGLDFFKGIKEIDISKKDDEIIIDTISLKATNSFAGIGTWELLTEVDANILNNCIVINSVSAKKGELDSNKYFYFYSTEGEFYLINTNDILLTECAIPCTDEFNFAIKQENCANLKKFVSWANNKADTVKIFSSNGFVKFSCLSSDNVLYEILIPTYTGDRINHVTNVLHKLINTKWTGVPITIDTESMYEDSVFEAYSEYMNHHKRTKSEKKAAKKEYDAFLSATTKEEGYSNLGKIFEITFFNISKSLNRDLYILRTLYENFISSISEFDYSIYFLTTEASALLFGFKDEYFRFKSLFMLRRPVKEVEEVIEDSGADEEYEYDTFEAT